MYSEERLVRIARRENNSKRSYLVVNALQGKHLPVSPGKALGLFGDLADRVQASVMGERVLVIGFAETATAIGAAISVALGCAYLQTTRETVEGRTYLYFSETHSHATEQKLDKEDLDRILPNLDRIVFAEDELTTGNTILNLVDVLEREFGHKVQFAAACLLSGMTRESVAAFEARGIALHVLCTIDHSGYAKRALTYPNDGTYHEISFDPAGQERSCTCCPGRLDARRLVNGSVYQAGCEALWRDVQKAFSVSQSERILILGTEEFMYPGLYLASRLEALGAQVCFHATTRSPIMVSSQAEYPLHARWELKSLYDSQRTTFLYELSAYDRVFVVTDAPARQTEGLLTLLAALRQAGNQTIHVIRWCDV